MTVLLTLERALARTVARDLRRREAREAHARALARFARLHPRWHASLFDAAFLARLPAGPEARDPEEIARAWTRQFRYRDERRRERDVRQLRPVAASWLRLLAEAEAELAPERRDAASPRPPARAGTGVAPYGHSGT